MLASFGAELIKLRKRPATWVLGGILLTVVALFGYVFNYIGLRQAASAGLNPEARQVFELGLSTKNLISTVAPLLAWLGGMVALILGARSAGSEYGWNTLKMVLTQKPGRAQVLGGKLLGLAAVLAVYVLAALVTGAVLGLLFGRLLDLPIGWPSAWDLLRGAAAAWLVMVALALLGYTFATLLRSTSLAVGLGLVYLLVIESLVSGFAGRLELLAKVEKAMLGPNAEAVIRPFELPDPAFAGDAAISAMNGALALGAVAATLAIISALALRRRDVA